MNRTSIKTDIINYADGLRREIDCLLDEIETDCISFCTIDCLQQNIGRISYLAGIFNHGNLKIEPENSMKE